MKTFFGHFMELKLLLFWERKKENRYTCLTREREREESLFTVDRVCKTKKVIVYKVCGGLKLSIKDPKISRIFLLNFFKGSFSKLCGATIAVSDCFS